MKTIDYLILAFMILGVAFTSCDKNGDKPMEFIVSFDSNGGSEVPSQIVRVGEKIVQPYEIPTLKGYTFVVWRKDVELKTKWMFDTDIVTTDITLYAEWIKNTDKEKQACDGICLDCNEFCLYTNVIDFYKTAPFINDYLINLTKNDWSDERKLQALTEWLNAKPCIIRAELVPVGTRQAETPVLRSTLSQPPRGIISILICENGNTKELFLEIGPSWPYESDLWVANGYSYMEPGEVSVFIKPTFTVSMVFDFINSFDFEVLRLDDICYTSSTYNRDFILDNITGKKNYYGGAVGLFPGTQLFSPLFRSMENKDYQADWLKFMADYHLSVIFPPGFGGALITFLVPDGEEIEWMVKFLRDYKFIDSASIHWGYQGMWLF